MPAARAPHKTEAAPHFSLNRVLERAQSQWIFSPAELQRAPSILDGMDRTQEQSNRSKGVNFITQVGMLLKLPQLTLATASVYLHRFFMRHSMVDLPNRPGLHHYAIAATALFLATKVEENCRKMKELVVACCRVAQKQPSLIVDEQSKEYWKWRDTILHNEDLLLEALCFDLQLEQPYRILFEFLCYYGVQNDKNLRNVSWAYLNDANLTTMCLLFPTRLIAGSALYAAAKFTGVTFPDEQGRPWWEHLGLDIGDIRSAVDLMAEIYESSVMPRQGQKEVYLKAGLDDPEATRAPFSPGTAHSPAESVGAESQGVKRDREDDDTWAGNDKNGAPSVAQNGQDQINDLARLRGGEAPHIVDEEPQRQASSQAQERYSGVPPSPKRQRLESFPNDDGAQRASPPSLVHRSTGGSHDIDEVQSRIDAIVNATATTSQNAHSHPPLSRRTSQREQQWPGPPPRRRSSSISSRQRPSSRQESYVGHSGQVFEQRRPSPQRQPSYEYEGRQRSSSSSRRRSHDFAERRADQRDTARRRPSYDHAPLSRQESFNRSDVSQQRSPLRTRPAGDRQDQMRDRDGRRGGDADHSGSEEGEL
jgi:protein BUR2